MKVDHVLTLFLLGGGQFESEADIWLSSYDHLTDVNNSRSERVLAFYSKRKKLQVGLIPVNDDEERNGGQAGRVYGCQL